MGMGSQRHVLTALRPGARCIGGWVGFRAGMGSEENLVPSGVRTLEHPGHRGWLYRPTGSLLFFFMALRPNAGQGLHILQVSRSHTTTHRSR